MKNTNMVSTIGLSVALILGFAGATSIFAATDPGLGAAASFSIIGQTAITGTGTMSEDVGLNNTGAGITALTGAMVDGTIYSTDGVAPSTAILSASVQANLLTANDNISGQASMDSIGSVLDGQTLTPGVYDIGAARLNGGILTLDGSGVFIIRASSDLVSSGSVVLTNGARACDVYWQVDSLATINGSSFIGTIIAGTGVHFGANVALNGRALALGGDVTLLDNTISGPSCPTLATLHVVKTVVNDNGGTAVASDFNLHVTLSGSDVVGSPAIGAVTPGTTYSLSAGAYVVSEDANAAYAPSFGGDCDSSGNITLSPGDEMTCTVTNTYIAPTSVPTAVPTATPTTVVGSATLRVIKSVINNNGGTSIASDFTLNVTGTNVSDSSFVGSTSGVNITLDAGSYAVTEPIVPSGYLKIDSGDCSGTIAAGETKTCTITNDDIPPTVKNDTIPKLPNTGVGPDEKSMPWNFMISTGIFSALILYYVSRRKQTA